MNIGKIIKEIRADKDISQRDLSRATRINPKTLQAIEKGRIKNPSLSSLKRIAKALDTPLNRLFALDELKEPTICCKGTPSGEYVMDFKKYKFKLLSYTPKYDKLFCGKATLGGRSKIEKEKFNFKSMFFIQALVGKLTVDVEGKEYELTEGENILFDGRLNFTISNPQNKDASFLVFTAPSIVS